MVERWTWRARVPNSHQVRSTSMRTIVQSANVGVAPAFTGVIVTVSVAGRPALPGNSELTSRVRIALRVASTAGGAAPPSAAGLTFVSVLSGFVFYHLRTADVYVSRATTW